MCHGNQEPCTKSEEQVSQHKRWYLMMIYREDINVDSKRIKVKEMVQLMEKITMITLFTLTI